MTVRQKLRVDVAPSFLLCAGLIYFFDTTGFVSAAVPAIAAHELGHAAALRLCSCRVTRFRLALPGFSMDYSGALTRAQEIFAALSGPAAGLIFAAAAYLTGRKIGSGYLLCSADISLLLSAFNLLPIASLDGGRALGCVLGERAAKTVSAVTAALLFALGAYVMRIGYGAALMLVGAMQIINLVKSSDLM